MRLIPNYPVSYPAFVRLHSAMRRLKPDLIHVHTPGLIGSMGFRIAQVNKWPVVASYHTHYEDYSHYMRPLPRKMARAALFRHTQKSYLLAHSVITPTELSKRWLRFHGIQAPIYVVPTPPGNLNLPDRDTTRAGLRLEGKIALLYVGRLSEEKNLYMLLRAVEPILSERVELLIVGDGPMREEIEHWAIGKPVRVLGSMPREEVARYYAASDLFVFASTSETQGLVVNEAQSANLPALVARGGATRFGIRTPETGIISCPSLKHYSNHLRDLVEHPEKLLAMRQALEAAPPIPGPEVMAQKVLQVYRSVLNDRA